MARAERHIASHGVNVAVLLVGGTVLAWMLHRLGFANVRRVLAGVGGWFALIVALDLAALACGAGAFHQFLRPEARMVHYLRQSVRTQRYAVLRDVVPSLQRVKLRRYVRQLRERGYFPVLGDGQVALRASIHNQPTIASLHQGLANIINTFGEEHVIPSYCYLSCYEEGSVLDRHLDRQQCAYNLCLVLDMPYTDRDGEPDPWPIYLELEGKPVPALLNVGDGIFFSGRSIYHWRDALPQGQRAVVCF